MVCPVPECMQLLKPNLAVHRLSAILLCSIFVLYAGFWVNANRRGLFDPQLQHDDARQLLFFYHQFDSGSPLKDDPVAAELWLYNPPFFRLLYRVLVPFTGVLVTAKIVQGLCYLIVAMAVLLLIRSPRAGLAAGLIAGFLILHTEPTMGKIPGGLPKGFAYPVLMLWLAGALTSNWPARAVAALIGAATYPAAMLLVLASETSYELSGALRAPMKRLKNGVIRLVLLGFTCDWRRLEFPAATNRIPRFFRADPDHEGMVKDQQVRRLVKLKKNEKTLTMAAAKAGLSRKTARKYLKSGKLPSQCQPERYWRTRSDPFESVWPEVEEILKRSPTVEGTAVFEYLCRQQEGAFQQGQLRTLQRRIKQWKAEYGEAKEVMFPQKYRPGHQAQSDFTFMGRLGVTIQGQPFPHLLYHFVLAYSNWEATTLCFSESFESLSLGLQNALWELGALPEEHRTDRLSAAVKNLQRDEFTERYQGLLRHLGMRSSHIQAGKAHENGDVEQAHHRLKRAIEQELLLRCSRDFASREEYEGFVAVIVARRNAARQKRLTEELAVMRPLPARRLDDFTRQWVRISPSSTIRVRHNTYSVDSRLIGERVQVRVWADQVEVYYGGRRQARMPRLRGEGKHRIDYRHVIHSLVRKPGAFTRYRWRQDLFPGILFRVAYDELRQDCPATADRQYLKILEVAAQEGEQRVREALQVLIERGQRIRFEALRECLIDPVVEPWEVAVEKMDVGLYDTLLESREVRS